MEQLMDPNLVNDVVEFVKSHPVLSGALGSWLAASEAMPFFKRVKSNGAIHGVWGLLVKVAKVILELNKARGKK